MVNPLGHWIQIPFGTIFPIFKGIIQVTGNWIPDSLKGVI